MAIQQSPLDQRLAGILPEQSPAPMVEPLDLQPMPAENVAETPEADTTLPGTPNMEEGVQVASKGSLFGKVMEALTSSPSKPERNVIAG